MNNLIGNCISENRQNLNMTQEELASRLGVTAQAVSKWERGSSMPDIGLLVNLCRILQMDANILLGLKENSVVENNDMAMEREIRSAMFAEPLTLEIGRELIPYFIEGLKTGIVNCKRKELAAETGMLMPLLRIRDDLTLKPKELVLKSYDTILYQTEWEEPGENTFADSIAFVKNQCREHYDSIINKQIVKIIIDSIKTIHPGVADGLVPEKIGYLTVLQFLRKKIKENGNIRDIVHILEELETEEERKKLT